MFKAKKNAKERKRKIDRLLRENNLENVTSNARAEKIALIPFLDCFRTFWAMKFTMWCKKLIKEAYYVQKFREHFINRKRFIYFLFMEF